MKAVVFHKFGSSDKLKLEEVKTPEIGTNEILVKVKVCGVNRLDLLLRNGDVPDAHLPHICGSEVAGIVDKVGSKVSSPKIGERVAIAPWIFCGKCDQCLKGNETTCPNGDILGMHSNGGYAEFVKVPAVNAVKIPIKLDFKTAAAVTLSALTAWRMLNTRAKLKKNETVLVHAGGSGVGSSAIQIARYLGAKVIATASTEDKRKNAYKLGADIVIDSKADGLSARVMKETNGKGVDVVFEHVGKDTWQESMKSLKKNGRIVTCGGTTGYEVNLDTGDVIYNEFTILGSRGGTRVELKEVLDLVAKKKIKPLIDKEFPLKNAAEAQERMESRKQFGKMLLLP